ncbi:hypothetical protein OC844_006026 [Tilletia horrida]|nr:hypothetical protein OC844_006026 [Tilletia horrida]
MSTKGVINLSGPAPTNSADSATPDANPFDCLLAAVRAVQTGTADADSNTGDADTIGVGGAASTTDSVRANFINGLVQASGRWPPASAPADDGADQTNHVFGIQHTLTGAASHAPNPGTAGEASVLMTTSGPTIFNGIAGAMVDTARPSFAQPTQRDHTSPVIDPLSTPFRSSADAAITYTPGSSTTSITSLRTPTSLPASFSSVGSTPHLAGISASTHTPSVSDYFNMHPYNAVMSQPHLHDPFYIADFFPASAASAPIPRFAGITGAPTARYYGTAHASTPRSYGAANAPTPRSYDIAQTPTPHPAPMPALGSPLGKRREPSQEITSSEEPTSTTPRSYFAANAPTPRSYDIAQTPTPHPAPMPALGSHLGKRRSHGQEITSSEEPTSTKKRRGQPLQDISNEQETDKTQVPRSSIKRNAQPCWTADTDCSIFVQLLKDKHKYKQPVSIGVVHRHIKSMQKSCKTVDETARIEKYLARDRTDLVSRLAKPSFSNSHRIVMEASRFVHIGIKHERIAIGQAGFGLRPVVFLPDENNLYFDVEQPNLDWNVKSDLFYDEI